MNRFVVSLSGPQGTTEEKEAPQPAVPGQSKDTDQGLLLRICKPFPCQVSRARYSGIFLPFPQSPSSSKTSPATAPCSYFSPTSLDSTLVSSLGHPIWGGDLRAVEPGEEGWEVEGPAGKDLGAGWISKL